MMAQEDEQSDGSFRSEGGIPRVFTPKTASELSRATTHDDTTPNSDTKEDGQQDQPDEKEELNLTGDTSSPLQNEATLLEINRVPERTDSRRDLDAESMRKLVLEAILENGVPKIDNQDNDELRYGLFSKARQHISEATSLLDYVNNLEATVVGLQKKLKSGAPSATSPSPTTAAGTSAKDPADTTSDDIVTSGLTIKQDKDEALSTVQSETAPVSLPILPYSSPFGTRRPISHYPPYPGAPEPHGTNNDDSLDGSGGAIKGCSCASCKEKRVKDLGEDVWKVETKREIHVVDTYDRQQILPDTSEASDSSIRKRTSEHVLTVFRDFNKEKVHTQTILEIGSPRLVEVLIEAIGSYPGDVFKGLSADTVRIPEPYMMLFHNRKKLQSALTKLEGLKHDHLQLLLEFLRTEMPTASRKLDELERGECTKIGYSEVWLIYTPGTVIYIAEDQDWCASKIQSLRGFTKAPSGLWTSLHIESVGRIFNDVGCALVPLPQSYTLSSFAGEELISNLMPLPSGFSAKEEDIRKDLLARGLQYWNFRSKGHCREYTGSAWVKAWQGDTVRVMVDYSTSSRYGFSTHGISAAAADPFAYSGMAPDPYQPMSTLPAVSGCNCLDCQRYRRDAGFPAVTVTSADTFGNTVQEHKEPEIFQEGTLLFCPAEVYAFSLPGKDWKLVKIRELQDVAFDEDALKKKLVIENSYRKVVTAMVKSYLSKDATFTDFIKGKGRGLVVLLHGSPGTGKTLTAECVAEKERRPLYMVTCGDLGTEPATMEDKLKETFERAINWNAVLLLDEADVFLQERDIHDLKRNALVSVFLRQLEYFDGILFLTTNRPGSLDEAFQSRIHITLGLPDLTRKNQLKVWSLFISDLKIDKDEEKNKAEQLKLLRYVEKNILKDEPQVEGAVKTNWLNGRQIRNSVRAAVALASQEGRPISKEHIQEVVDIGKKFTDYMIAINRMNQQQLAFARGTRGPSDN